MNPLSVRIGAVAIGRNEGARLKTCLRSLIGLVDRIVYVDSGSTDGSVEFALGLGVEVVNLDTSKPFTMARGRNAGFARLEQILPEMEFVQFVDGDCEVEPGWIHTAATALQADPRLGSVCGHRTERYPERSLYNRITDMDWRGKTGDVAFCGGDVLMRTTALQQTGGYVDHMIAGEDPEICVRLRQLGWKLHRLDVPMTRHDVAMLRFGQLWKRNVRSGHAYAEGAWMHRNSAERPWQSDVRSNFFWGLFLPVVILATAVQTHGLTLLLWLLYVVWMWKIAHGRKRTFDDSTVDAWLYGFFCMLCKLPCALGQLLYFWRLLTHQTPQLIEYKINPIMK
ncbi:MAG TPA: glycosyltransferase [Planctomycetaceae bacterium]|nr:glycosyltransferase [Planctomycetaceae bacterium]